MPDPASHPETNPESNQRAAFLELLEMIPLVGKPLGWVFKHLGTAGFLSFLAGGMAVAVLVFLGKYPSRLVSDDLAPTQAVTPDQLQPVIVPEPEVVDLRGAVYDLFGNPLAEEVVLIASSDRYSTTDKQGVFTFQSIPYQKQVSLELAGGGGRQRVELGPGDMGRMNLVPDTLLKDPLTRDLTPVLCASMPELEPVGEFSPIQDDQYTIDLSDLDPDPESGLHIIWCRVTLFGHEDDGLNRDLELFFDWYNDGKGPVTYSDKVKLRPYGWRHKANKKVWKGNWELVIRTRYKKLQSLRFEVR